MMSRSIRSLVCLIALSVIFFQVSTPCYGFEISIDVAPAVLNLQNNGQVVTVHTDIAYGEVDASTIYLNGVAINSWKADNRGNFVAKFLIDAIKSLDGLIIGDYNTLQLVGATIDGDEFIGVQDILVINNVPAGKQ
jgi:hypothetical protein